MQSSTQGRVLVIGDDMRIFLSVVRSFGRRGRTVEAVPYGPSPALTSRYISRIFEVPSFEADRAGWEDVLLGILCRETYDLVVPCSDPAIAFLDAHRSLLAAQKLAIPPAAAMTAFYDKAETHRLCKQLGVPMAPAACLAPADTADSLISAYGLPLVLKPRRTFFADREQAREIVEIIEHRAEAVRRLNAIDDRSRYLVEGYFEGDGVGISVLAQNGTVLQAFQHRRLREGKGGASSYRVSEAVDPGMAAACAKLCSFTRHTGVCMFEFRHRKATGEWILLEINARFWGSMALPLSIGIDFPNLLFDLMVHAKQPEAKAYVAGIRSRNFMLDGFNLVKRLRSLRFIEAAQWLADCVDFGMQPLRWLTGAERSDTFALDDLKPALWEFSLLARKLSSFGQAKPAPEPVQQA